MSFHTLRYGLLRLSNALLLVIDSLMTLRMKQANHKSQRLANNARDVEIIKNEKGIRRKLQYSYMQRITLAELNLIMPTLGKTKSDALLKLQINIYAKGFDSQIPASKDLFTSSSDAAKGTTAYLYDRL